MMEEVGEVWKYDPKYHRVAEFLGLDVTARQDYRVWQKVSYLMNQASIKAKSGNIVDQMHVLDKLRKSIGITAQGETLINSLYQTARLEQDRQALTDTRAVQKKEVEEEVKKEPAPVEQKKDEQ